jgi:hypothetical protein
MKTWKGVSIYEREGLSGSMPVIGCWLILFALLLAACSVPGTTVASETPSQTDESSPSSLQLTPDASSAAPATELPGNISQSVRADLPDLGAAPELSNEVWLNTDQPLRLADLEGKVVLLDMWTFG